MMKLGLGTVQFGLNYGISNNGGQTTPLEVKKILEVAANNGIQIIDTASLYGTSEDVLGETLPSDHNFLIITKTPKFNKSTSDIELLAKTFRQSLLKLKQHSIYGLLIHNAMDLFTENGFKLFQKMQEFKAQGLVKKIGVSVYTANEIDYILDNYSIDLIQLPLNIFDQRLINSGHLKKLKRYGVEIHARSIFLQGLLLIEPNELPPYFDTIKEHLLKYHNFLKQKGITTLEAAIDFAIGLEEVDKVIIGFNNHQQLEEICSIKAGKNISFDKFMIDDEKILNPSLWKK